MHIDKIDIKEFVGLLFQLTGYLLVIFNFRAIIYANASKNWDSVKGRIEESNLYISRRVGSDDLNSYKPNIRYSYKIEDKAYYSKRVYFGCNVMSSTKKRKSEKIVERYFVGKDIDVFYNRMNEKMSVLEPGIKSEIVFGLFIGIVITIIGWVLF